MADFAPSWEDAVRAWRAAHPNATPSDEDTLAELHLRFADGFSGRGDPRGLEAYAAAEQSIRRCRSIGCGAEGLAMMGEIHQIWAAKARLHERIGGPAHLRAALAIWSEIAEAPNRTGAWAAPHQHRVRWRIRGAPELLVRIGARGLIGGGLVVAALAWFGPAVLDDSLPVHVRSTSAAAPVLLLLLTMALVQRTDPRRTEQRVAVDRDSVAAGDDGQSHAIERRVNADVPVAVFIVNLMHTYLPAVAGRAVWRVRVAGPRGVLEAVLVQQGPGRWEDPRWRLSLRSPKRTAIAGFSSVRFVYEGPSSPA